MVLLLTSEHVLHSPANIAIDAENTHWSVDFNTSMLVYPTANPIINPLLHNIETSLSVINHDYPTINPLLTIIDPLLLQWEFQDPKMEVLYLWVSPHWSISPWHMHVNTTGVADLRL